MEAAPTNNTGIVTPASVRAPTTLGQEASSKAFVSVSSRFNMEEVDMVDTDVILVARDQVCFFAHSIVLLHGSSNRFGSLLTDHFDDSKVDMLYHPAAPALSLTPRPIPVDCPSDTLNLVLHAIYQFSVSRYSPSASTLRTATSALFDLGYDLDIVFSQHTEPYMLFLRAAVAEPLPMYALCAHYSIEALAIATSTFTLGVSLSDVSDQLAEQMGPIYLRRLFFLHMGRADALKRLLYPPPLPHVSCQTGCAEKNQQEITRVWSIACASMMIEGSPDDVTGIFAPLSGQLSCVKCRQALHERVMTLFNEWIAIRATI